MDPRKLPFNALIVGPTNSGKTQYLLIQLRGPFRGRFDYIMLLCPTFVKNTTYEGFVDRDPHIFVIACLQHEIEPWLRLASYYFMGTNTLFVFDDCAASKEVKGRTSQLVNLVFSARHDGISVWTLTQQITSIAKPFRENVAAIVLFYTPSSKTTKAIFEVMPASSPTRSTKRLSQNSRGASSRIWFSHCAAPMGLRTTNKCARVFVNIHIYPAAMNTPASLHKLTVLSQLLYELRAHTLAAQNQIIKTAGKEDLRYMLLNRYPLRLNALPDTMAGLIQELDTLLPDIKRIIEN